MTVIIKNIYTIICLNWTFDVLLECFSDFFTNMSVTTVFSTGQHWHRRTGLGPCAQSVEILSSLTEPSHTLCFLTSFVFYSPCIMYPVSTQAHLYSQCSMLCVDASLKDTNLLQAHFHSGDLLSIPMETWKGAGSVACQCAYSVLHKQWKIHWIISPLSVSKLYYAFEEKKHIATITQSIIF